MPQKGAGAGDAAMTKEVNEKEWAASIEAPAMEPGLFCRGLSLKACASSVLADHAEACSSTAHGSRTTRG